MTSACCGAVSRLATGSVEFAAGIDAAENDQALLLAQVTLVIALRADGKPAPIYGVTAALDRLEAAAAEARRLRLGDKLCVHPAQATTITEAWCPTVAEIGWAREITAAAGRQADAGAIQGSGRMIDKPVLDRAHRILDHAASSPECTAGRKEA